LQHSGKRREIKHLTLTFPEPETTDGIHEAVMLTAVCKNMRISLHAVKVAHRVVVFCNKDEM